MTEILHKKRVLVAMSGGVDSSVALLKVLEEGYDAFGVTMKLWESRDSDGHLINDSTCCSLEAVNNAKLVCQKLRVPHYTLDFQKVFQEKVVDYFAEEYFSGRTPNPCIQCNAEIRWHALLEKAKQLGVYWIATGHYAKIDRTDPNNPFIRKGMDITKDQSYVLWKLSQTSLKRTLFPLGDLTKQEVRVMASQAHLVTAEVAESQEICFVPNHNYRHFMRDYYPQKVSQDIEGNFISPEGKFLGKHQGISNYTIGQRRRLGVTGPEAHYVQQIDARNKTIILAPKRNMYFNGCHVRNLNWHCNIEDFQSEPIKVHIRYRHSGVSCRLVKGGNDRFTISFDSPQFAVTPGQSAVFYTGDRLLGGGIITKAFLNE